MANIVDQMIYTIHAPVLLNLLNSCGKKEINWSFLVFFFCFFVFLFFYYYFQLFLISPETVKLVIGKPTVCIVSLNILSFS